MAAPIVQGNTLTDPKFKDGETVKQFDFVVANPPFSDKRWSTGLDPLHDPHDRFKAFGIPPAKQGDYAYLLHIVRSLKSNGTGACILPHGVLFRGNAEADIRRVLVRKGYIKGIIGLPANLFYGTGIPACIVVMDKKDAQARKAIFMIDASEGFVKDGPKNRLRARDIHKIVDAFNKTIEIPGYSRVVPLAEIENNDFNLNLSRYIDSQKTEDRQDIDGHLRGGIPRNDVDALEAYWNVCPGLKAALFSEYRPGYVELAVDKAAIKSNIFEHSEFVSFMESMAKHFDVWRQKSAQNLKELNIGTHPKEVVADLSEGLLVHYSRMPLIHQYDVYQHLMDYWAETMQDDCYAIAVDGWKAEPYRIIEKDKKGQEKDKGWACDLIPKSYIVARFFAKERADIDVLATKLEAASTALGEFEEEHCRDDGALAEFDKVNRGAVNMRLREIKGDREMADEAAIFRKWLELSDEEADLKKRIRTAEADLDAKALAKYPDLDASDIKTIVVEDKWLAKIEADVHGEMDRISRTLTYRVRTLAERYEVRMPDLVKHVAALDFKVEQHLKRMGFAWS